MSHFLQAPNKQAFAPTITFLSSSLNFKQTSTFVPLLTLPLTHASLASAFSVMLPIFTPEK